MDLPAKRAVITGAARGIGRAVARLFAAEGWGVVVSDVDADALDELAVELERQKARYAAVVADVADVAQVHRLFAEAEKALGDINVLVNCAGMRLITDLLSVTEEQWDRVMDVNVKGTFFSMQAVVPTMRRAGGGKIVNLGSVSGIVGVANRAPYCAAKAAVDGLTRQAAVELAASNIQVVAVAPGYTAETEMTAMYDDEVIEAMRATLPLGTDRHHPKDVAETVLFLASDRTRAISGTTVVVDNALTTSLLPDAWPWHITPELQPLDRTSGTDQR